MCVEILAPKLSLPDGTSLPFSVTTRAIRLIFSPGQLCIDASFRLIDGGVDAQARQCIAHIQRILGSIGASLADIAKTTVRLTDFSQFTAFNIAYSKAFGGHPLARSTVAWPLALPCALVEIEAIARDPIA